MLGYWVSGVGPKVKPLFCGEALYENTLTFHFICFSLRYMSE
jgi:hypothetical protein